MNITNNNFELFAAKEYDNPDCQNTEEFYEDIARLKYIKRLFNRYINDDILKDRLIINHFVVLFNVFGVKTTIILLFLRIPEHYMLLKTFLLYFNQCPESVMVEEDVINIQQLPIDIKVLDKLKQLK